MAQASLPLDQIIAGDCIDAMRSMPHKSVDLVFADPPYNLQLHGDLWRPNMTRVDAADDDWDQFGHADGDQFVSFAHYDAFTREWLTEARRVMKDTATLWVIGSYHNIYRIGTMLLDMGFWILNDVVWIKPNPVPQMRGVRFCNAHETLLWVAKSKELKKHTFNYHGLKAGNEDRQMRSEWHIPICSGSERVTVNGEKAHSTQKPEALLHRVIASSTNRGDIVLDPFCGTGTTAAVAKKLGRRFITVDRETRYVCAARERVDSIVPVPAELADDDALYSAPKPRVPFVSLVEQGLVPPGSKLQLQKSVPPVLACVHEDGSVSVNGFRGSIHKVASQCLGLPACNGWTTWYYTEEGSGQLRLIDELRFPRASGEDALDLLRAAG